MVVRRSNTGEGWGLPRIIDTRNLVTLVLGPGDSLAADGLHQIYTPFFA